MEFFYSFGFDENMVSFRLVKKEGAEKRPPNAPAVFFFLARPLFFSRFEGTFFSEPSFRPLFFLGPIFGIFTSKTTIWTQFFLFFGFALFPPSFFFFRKRPLFSKKFLRAIFLRPLSALFFFSRPPF